MGKINGCLKVLFIIFNSLFTCFGALMMYGLGRIAANGYQMGGTGSLNMITGWIFAVGVVGISLLGSHGARTENKCCLTAFAVFMGIGLVLMLIFGVAAIVLKKQYCREAEGKCEAEFLFNISIGVNFGFAFVAMMGLIISTNMINQISRHDNAAVPAIAMRTY
ncbi:tetraspanin-1-like [Xiphophorus maculatus]|uniref:tetraspanin-1-like n=1 Tax=Xiphophorus maculatus TaxID=8083 RepID=UPI000C6E3001|nr:tetraspanin-1-like [Xiphophorus maculatus]